SSVFLAEGGLGEAPTPLWEVQAYVYSARRSAARLARMLGKFKEAERLQRQAHELQEKFERVFWCDELSMYALALDGKKDLCRVRSSNAGHALFSGIASMDH